MRRRQVVRLLAVTLAVTLAGTSCRRAATPGPVADGPTGEARYSTFCVACHGHEGRGDGLASAYGRTVPADFTQARFKVRSTPVGSLPTDADLADVIRRGAGGDGAMPAFAFLSDEDVSRLVAYLKGFSPRWRQERPGSVVALPARVEGDARRGQGVYSAWGCAECHGPSGREPAGR